MISAVDYPGITAISVVWIDPVDSLYGVVTVCLHFC